MMMIKRIQKTLLVMHVLRHHNHQMTPHSPNHHLLNRVVKCAISLVEPGGRGTSNQQRLLGYQIRGSKKWGCVPSSSTLLLRLHTPLLPLLCVCFFSLDPVWSRSDINQRVLPGLLESCVSMSLSCLFIAKHTDSHSLT